MKIPALFAACVFASLFLPVTLVASPAADVAGNLVALQGKSVSKFDDAALAKTKFVAVYYSASWCGPCREFTPELVRWYKTNKSKYPQFELIFVSNDRSEEDMEEYMKMDEMPWPAVSFKKIASSANIRQYAGPGIPCLVFLDNTGKVLSDSYEGETYVGPDKVLKDMKRILAAAPVSALDSPAAATDSKVGSGKFDIFAGKK